MDAALAAVDPRIVPAGSGDRPGPVVASLGGGDRWWGCWGWLGLVKHGDFRGNPGERTGYQGDLAMKHAG